MPLLLPEEPAPVRLINPAGRAPFLLIGDHAGNLVPAKLARLRLDDAELSRHIAIDIGVSALGTRLAALLDACFIEQRYSRLVVDCNRHADAGDAMAAGSDGTNVPANHDLTPADRAARVSEIHAPYHRTIAATLTARQRAGHPTVLIALHSFTPTMAGVARPWDIGVLHDRGNVAFAAAVLPALRQEPGICVGENQPYQMDDTDFTVPYHAYPTGLPYAELEVSQRLLTGNAGIADMAGVLAKVLNAALANSTIATLSRP